MKSILSVLFDIKPVDRMGNFDFEKIRKIESIINLRNVNIKNKEIDVQEVLTKEKILEELEEIERSDIGLKEIKQSKSVTLPRPH